METLEEGVKYVPINNKDTRMTPIVNFGQGNADWAKHKFDQMIQLYVRNDTQNAMIFLWSNWDSPHFSKVTGVAYGKKNFLQSFSYFRLDRK